jgi:beta-lactamase superfamily II metal-dependent hydrolase
MPPPNSQTRLSGSDWATPPAPDQIEITLLGPGFGETLVVHVGSNRWLIVDSCVDAATGNPAALDYLNALDVPSESAVELIAATHWHDDHIRGLSKVLEACPNAAFTCSSAMQRHELLQMVQAFSRQVPTVLGSGVSEIARIFDVVASRQQAVRLASSSRLLRIIPSKSSTTGDTHIYSLSPSDAQTQLALLQLPEALARQTKRRADARSPNHFSVVLWISAGSTKVLLGGDLEDPGQPTLGWRAIVADATRPAGKGAVFKVPHHGSETAYYGPVWDEMLIEECYALLTPWTLGGGALPTAEGVRIILKHTTKDTSDNNRYLWRGLMV